MIVSKEGKAIGSESIDSAQTITLGKQEKRQANSVYQKESEAHCNSIETQSDRVSEHHLCTLMRQSVKRGEGVCW